MPPTHQTSPQIYSPGHHLRANPRTARGREGQVCRSLWTKIAQVLSGFRLQFRLHEQIRWECKRYPRRWLSVLPLEAGSL